MPLEVANCIIQQASR